MANIATGFVRLIPTPQSQYLPVGDILNLLCSGWRARSYHVPIFVRQNEITLVTDIQLGGRWSVTPQTYKVWMKYRSVLESIWIREFDSGADHDTMVHINHDNYFFYEYKDNFRLCRYGFDHIKITWKPDFIPFEINSHWIKDGDVWSIAMKGSYLAGNDRCLLLLSDAEVTSMKTLTSLTPGRNLERLSWPWDFDELQPLPTEVFSHIENNAVSVEFYWKQRLVRLRRREGKIRSSWQVGWRQYCLDDWDNCVDKDWLAFSLL